MDLARLRPPVFPSPSYSNTDKTDVFGFFAHAASYENRSLPTMYCDNQAVQCNLKLNV